MNKTKFTKILKAYKLRTENIHEDISALGSTIWHNDKLAVIVECAHDKRPCMVIVILRPTGSYSYFECNLKEFDSSTTARFIEYVKDQSGPLYEAALIAHDKLMVSIDGKDWLFGITY